MYNLEYMEESVKDRMENPEQNIIQLFVKVPNSVDREYVLNTIERELDASIIENNNEYITVETTENNIRDLVNVHGIEKIEHYKENSKHIIEVMDDNDIQFLHHTLLKSVENPDENREISIVIGSEDAESITSVSTLITTLNGTVTNEKDYGVIEAQIFEDDLAKIISNKNVVMASKPDNSIGNKYKTKTKPL